MELYRMLTMNIRHTIYTICQSIKTMAIGSLLCFVIQSCNEDSHTILPEEVAISMSASSSDMSASRALINSDEGLQATALGVYAFKQVNNTKTLVFDNTKLTYYATKGWDYSPAKYWDKAATIYRFVAYSPYTASNTSYDVSTNTLTISNIPYWQEINGSETDYLVASSSGSADYYLTQQQTSTAVNFNFSHILSQLVINVVKDDYFDDTDYKVKGIEYINVPAKNGIASYAYSSTSSNFSDISIISSTSTPSSVSMLFDDNGKEVTLNNANTGKITLSHLTVPFTLTGEKKVQVQVTYTVEGTKRSKPVDTGITKLEAGKRYELTLTFKGAEIVPELKIKNWVNVPVEEDPKYNW